MGNMTKNIDFSKYKHVFCDSREALEWAYKSGLSHDSIIYTSSPAMLYDERPNIVHIESRWNVQRMKEFQTTIQKFSEEVYDKVMLTNYVTHEESLCVAQAAVFFHRLLFKASCLTSNDLVDPRLFIGVDGNGGPGGNNMNPPWSRLLINNPKYKSITYTLKNDKWSTLTTSGISLWNRIRIGGIETLIYRLSIKLLGRLPSTFFRKQVLILNENELLIETAAALAMNGVRIRKIKPNKESTVSINKSQLSIIKRAIQPLVNKRIKSLVERDLVACCEEIFFQDVENKLNTFTKFRMQWQFLARESGQHKRVLLINAPGSIKGLAVASVCREIGVPVVSAQHGITEEICATHGEVSASNDINVSDVFLAYNSQSKKISESSYFSRGEAFSVGISARHLRMNSIYFLQKIKAPIVYVSTNLYRGNLGAFNTWETDYDRFVSERLLVSNVFSCLPHKVCYKTYPEDNRRYADDDPIIAKVKEQENMDLFRHKVDMRYLLEKYSVLVTSVATSTLGWLIMSGKPVVFINWINNGALTPYAHSIFSKGIFLFDDNEKLYENLHKFLSLPVNDIEKLWAQKKHDRSKMIKQFFTSSGSKKSGRAASKIIIDKYFK
jgi:hypothetical protein